MIEFVRGMVCLDLVRQRDAAPALVDLVDHLAFRSFPATQRVLYVVLLLRYDGDDAGRPHAITVDLCDPDGAGVAREIREEFTCVAGESTGPTPISGAAAFDQQCFERPGRYEFRIDLDGTEVGRVPLEVARAAA